MKTGFLRKTSQRNWQKLESLRFKLKGFAWLTLRSKGTLISFSFRFFFNFFRKCNLQKCEFVRSLPSNRKDLTEIRPDQRTLFGNDWIHFSSTFLWYFLLLFPFFFVWLVFLFIFLFSCIFFSFNLSFFILAFFSFCLLSPPLVRRIAVRRTAFHRTVFLWTTLHGSILRRIPIALSVGPSSVNSSSTGSSSAGSFFFPPQISFFALSLNCGSPRQWDSCKITLEPPDLQVWSTMPPATELQRKKKVERAKRTNLCREREKRARKYGLSSCDNPFRSHKVFSENKI